MATIEKKERVIIIHDFDFANNKIDDKTKKISENTVNTWQPGRSEKDKMADTSLGKIAEALFESYVNQFNITYLSYDNFRTNNLEKHAPFDGLIFSNEKTEGTTSFTARINEEVSDSAFGKISIGLLSDLTRSKIFTVEIKSTRVIDRHKTAGVVDLDKIKRDDFLTYPHDLRTTSQDFSLSAYADYLIRTGKLVVSFGENKITALRSYEKQFMMDVYVRVYIDETTKTAYLMGWISKKAFIDNATLKRMFQRGKSELPIYLATPISNGNSVDELSTFISNN